MAITAAAAFALDRTPGEMRDFEVYWTAGDRARSAEPLYRVEDGHYQFKYLPAFAVLAAPASTIPLERAKRLWFVTSVALLCTLLALSIRLVPSRRRPTGLLIAAMVIVMGKFYGHELVLGQVNLLFAVIAAAGILRFMEGATASACALFVAAAVVKPYAVLFLPWVVLRRGTRALAPIVIGGGIVLGLSVPLYGLAGTVDLHEGWWTTVTDSTAPNLTNADNVSLAGFFAKWFGQGTTASVLAGIGAVACVAIVALIVRRGRAIPQPEAVEGSALLILIPLISPQGWDYVFLIATPAVALLVNYADDLPGPLRAATYAALGTIGLSLFDLMGRARYATFMAWSVITVCFVILLLALFELRRRGVA